MKDKKDFEGWVVKFTNGLMIKIKCDHYCSIHGILTDFANREDYIIDYILSSTIDDVLALIPENDIRRDKILEAEKSVINYIKKTKIELNKLLAKFNGSRIDFYLNNKGNELIHLALSILNGFDVDDVIISFIRKNTFRLKDAREFLTTNKISL